ncbi:MAG: translation initiation factor IF-6 [Candidatus Methanomethylophilus sp.]|nr:translation initiation factor IF-6 [Methanomethylophilus sp.]
MRLSRTAGTFNIGVSAVANESLAFTSPDVDDQFLRDLEEALGVKPFKTTVGGSHVTGSLIAMNSNGAAVSGLAEEAELEVIRKQIPIVLLPDYINAAGNNILVNDHGAVVNPDFPDSILKQLEELFGVEVVRSAIAGCNTIGSLCKCNNKGCVCTIDATDDDVELLKEVLKVQEVQRTTVNHGSKYVGSGVIANSKGALVGDATTPIEMGRLEDGLVLY